MIRKVIKFISSGKYQWVVSKAIKLLPIKINSY